VADRGHAGFRFQQELGEGGGLIGAAARQRRREGRGERAQALAGLADQIGIKLELPRTMPARTALPRPSALRPEQASRW
jgi:hypothetical protein